MTTTQASIYLEVNGEDYIFAVNATDGSSATMVNLVSNQGIGDTFPNSARVTKVGPLVLNSSDAAGASKSILGAVLVDPNNNVVFQIGYVDPETSTIQLPISCNYQVGLNYVLTVLTANA